MMLRCVIVNTVEGRPYRDAQDRLHWRDKTCPACTQLIILQVLFMIVITQTLSCHVGLLFAGCVTESVLESLVNVTPFLS